MLDWWQYSHEQVCRVSCPRTSQVRLGPSGPINTHRTTFSICAHLFYKANHCRTFGIRLTHEKWKKKTNQFFNFSILKWEFSKDQIIKSVLLLVLFPFTVESKQSTVQLVYWERDECSDWIMVRRSYRNNKIKLHYLASECWCLYS